MPVEDTDTADTTETEAELVAALEEAEKSQDCKIAVLKAKINRFRCNTQSSRPPNSGPVHVRPPDHHRKLQIQLPKTSTLVTVEEKATFNLTATTANELELPWLVPTASRTPNARPPPSMPMVKLTPTPPPCLPPPHHRSLARDRSYTIRIHTLIQI